MVNADGPGGKDALASGASASNGVEVQNLLSTILSKRIVAQGRLFHWLHRLKPGFLGNEFGVAFRDDFVHF